MIPLALAAAGAVQAYARVAGGTATPEPGLAGPAADPATGFGAALGRAMQGVVQAGHEADAQSLRAIAGAGNLTEVATAVSRAELALQGAVAIRDKMVQAYQDVMRMPI